MDLKKKLFLTKEAIYHPYDLSQSDIAALKVRLITQISYIFRHLFLSIRNF